jgi:hypothetical protein
MCCTDDAKRYMSALAFVESYAPGSVGHIVSENSSAFSNYCGSMGALS